MIKSRVVLYLFGSLMAANAHGAPYSAMRWPITKANPVVTYSIDGSLEDVSEEIALAFQVWQDVSGAYVELMQVESGGNITLEAGGVATDWAAGEAYVSSVGGTIVSCSIQLDSVQIAVLIHEIGHCFGLMHSVVNDAVMSYRRDAADYTSMELQDDDRMAISALYPKDGGSPPLGCATVRDVSSSGGGSSGPGSMVFLGMLLLIAWWATRANKIRVATARTLLIAPGIAALLVASGCSTSSDGSDGGDSAESWRFVQPIHLSASGTTVRLILRDLSSDHSYEGPGDEPWRPEESSLVLRESTDGGVTWSTEGTTSNVYAEAATFASDGTAYLVGYQRGEKSGSGVVYNWTPQFLKLATDRNAFEVTAEFENPGDYRYNWCVDIAIDASNRLVAGCQSYHVDIPQNGTGYVQYGWYSLASADLGNIWSTTSTLIHEIVYDESNAISVPFKVFVTSAGTFLMSGSDHEPGGTVSYGIIKRSTDAGATWTTVDQLSTWTLNQTKGFRTDPVTGAIYVWGYGVASKQEIFIRKSTDDGATWAMVSHGESAGFPQDFEAQDLAIDSAGIQFIAGRRLVLTGQREENHYYAWEVYKSADSGVNWILVDELSVTAANGAYRITIDSSDQIYVAGWKKDEQVGLYHDVYTIVRTSSDGGATWETVLSER